MMVDENICIKSEPMDLEELNLPSNEDHNLTTKEEFYETPVKPKEVSETTSTQSKKSSRGNQTTKFKQLGFVFGSQITEFNKDVLPKECDVISVWISKIDQARGQNRQLGQNRKHEVIEDIVQSLIFIWQSQNLPILPALRIKDQVVKLTRRTEYIAKATKRKMGDKIWIEEQRELFNRIFNIGKRSKTKQPIDLGELNLPSSEDNLEIKEECSEISVKSEELSETSIKSETFIDASESYNELSSDLLVKNEDPLKVHEDNFFPCLDCDFSTTLKCNLTKHIIEVHAIISYKIVN